MRKLFALLLLLPSLSWASNISVVRCWTPDGPYVPVADTATKCPAQLTGGATNTVTDTSYNVTVNTTLSSGTIYVYTSTSATPPSRKAFIAGTGAVDHGTISVSASGLQTFAVTPVSAETQYYTHLLHMTTTGRPSNRRVVGQLTPAASPGSSIVVEGYFAGTGGSNFNAGTSHAARFLTYAPYLALTPATGTDMWLLAGSEFQNIQIDTDHGGTAGDYAEWACYYIDGSTPTDCTEGATGGELDTDDWLDRDLGSQDMPRIYGTLTEACIKPTHLGYSGAPTCTWPSPTAQGGAGPTADCSSTEDFFVWIRHSYVRIRGLWFDKIACMGMEVRKNGSTGFSYTEGEILGFQMKHSVISDTGLSHYKARQGIKYTAVVNNIFVRNSLCHESRLRGGTYPTITSGSIIQTCQSWAFGMSHLFSINSYSLYANNMHGAQRGEGIGIGRTTHALVHGTKVANAASGGLYLDVTSDSIIEASIGVGARNYKGTGSYPPTSGTSDGGGRFEIGAETYPQNSSAPFNPPGAFNNVMRNNIAVNLAGGFVTSQQVNTKFPLKYHVIHNTEIAGTYGTLGTINNHATYLDTASKLQNNIIASPTSTSWGGCASEWDQSDNLYVRASPPAACANAGTDVTAGTSASLVLDVGSNASPNTTNINTWRGYYIGSMPNANNAKSSLSRTGIQLNNVECGFADTAGEKTQWKNILKEIPGTYYDNDGNGTIDDTEVQKFAYCAYYDFGGNARANTPRIGAWEIDP